MHGMNASAAFHTIAQILDLACAQATGFNIRALTHTLPPPISPTLQQQIVPHQPYIDMLPWPSLRDKLLASPNAINATELLVDMASGDLKVWGRTAWDPAGWEVGWDFAKKWWFLMDDGIIQTTNFWRSQRGEEGLSLVSLPTPTSFA
jgi:hypothetical protein